MKWKPASLLCLLLCLSTSPVGAATNAAQQRSAQVNRKSRHPRPPITIWERMEDPKAWWQSRLAKPGLQTTSPRALESEPLPLDNGAIANPIFFIPPTFSTGGRLAGDIKIGDFNGDGKADLLVINQCVSEADCSQGTVGVLLGNGDGTYQPALVSNTGAVVSGVAVGDFNRDGKLDVAVGNECGDLDCTTGSVNILFGNGNGKFQAPVVFATGENAFSVEAGDVNGDGKLDLLVVDAPGSVGIFLGNGDGTFHAISNVTTFGVGNTAAFLGDFNGDHKLDLGVVTSVCQTTQCDTAVSVLLGNGDGTFQGPTVNPAFTGLNVQAVALGDANHDGKLDLAVVLDCVPDTETCGNDILTVLLGKGDGTFSGAKTSELASNDVTFAGLADLNGDNKPELLTLDPDAAMATELLGVGDGTFRLLSTYETEGISPVSGALGDLNGDGKIDFAVPNGCQLATVDNCVGNVIALLGDGQGSFAAPTGHLVDGSFPVLATADLNHDGVPDLIAGATCEDPNCTTSVLSVLFGTSNGTFQPPISYKSSGLNPSAVAASDLNGDGKLDLVAINGCATQSCNNGTIGVLLGKGDGSFSSPVTFPSGGSAPLSVAIEDFNGDGSPDLALAQCTDISSCSDGSKGTVTILLGKGDGSFGPPVNYSSGDPYATSVVAADFNRDGKIDLAVANGNCFSDPLEIVCHTGSVGVLLGNGDGTFQNAVTYSSVDDGAFSLTVGDLNGDGKLDLVVANNGCSSPNSMNCMFTGSVAVLLGNGDGTFQNATTYPAGDQWTSFLSFGQANALAIADLNGDGRPDLVLSNRDVLLGNGDGTFQAAQSYNPVGTLSGSAVVADFNRDGKPDLAVGEDAAAMVLLNVATGFAHATSTSLASFPNPANVHRRVTFIARVSTSSQETPTGTITFSDKGHALATEPVFHGQARFSTRSLDAGVHPVTAIYSGDQTLLPSTSPEIDQAIRADTCTRLTSSQNPSRGRQAVTFTAIVEANSGGTPTGTVTFRDYFKVLATVELSRGQATFTTSALHRGTHLIRVDYNGSPTDQHSCDRIAQRVR